MQGGWQATPVDHPGLFLATSETAQPGQLLRALRTALQVLAALHAQGMGWRAEGEDGVQEHPSWQG